MKKAALALAVAIVITLVFGTIYATVQHSLRMGANDPQIQLAEDDARLAETNNNPQDLVNGNVDVATSLAPFVIVYDKNHQVVASSAMLDGKTPPLPSGLFDVTTPDHQSRFTWQPQPRVRIAAVMVATPHYYVLAGRSLREVEKREDEIELMAALSWLASLVVLGTVQLFTLRRG